MSIPNDKIIALIKKGHTTESLRHEADKVGDEIRRLRLKQSDLIQCADALWNVTVVDGMALVEPVLQSRYMYSGASFLRATDGPNAKKARAILKDRSIQSVIMGNVEYRLS